MQKGKKKIYKRHYWDHSNVAWQLGSSLVSLAKFPTGMTTVRWQFKRTLLFLGRTCWSISGWNVMMSAAHSQMVQHRKNQLRNQDGKIQVGECRCWRLFAMPFPQLSWRPDILSSRKSRNENFPRQESLTVLADFYSPNTQSMLGGPRNRISESSSKRKSKLVRSCRYPKKIRN